MTCTVTANWGRSRDVHASLLPHCRAPSCLAPPRLAYQLTPLRPSLPADVCFVKSAGNWIHYDDNSRQVVGPNFADVKEKCVAGRLHPNALFFSKES